MGRSMTGIGFALGVICSAYPPASWLEHHRTTQLSGVVPSSSGQMRLPGASDSSSCLSMGKWALQLIKLLWGSESVKSEPPPNQLSGQSVPLIWFCWQVKLLVGVAPQALKDYLPRSVCWCYKPSLLLYHRFSATGSHRFLSIPMVRNQSRGSHKATSQCWRWLIVPAGFSFPTGATRGQRPLCIALYCLSETNRCRFQGSKEFWNHSTSCLNAKSPAKAKW